MCVKTGHRNGDKNKTSTSTDNLVPAVTYCRASSTTLLALMMGVPAIIAKACRNPADDKEGIENNSAHVFKQQNLHTAICLPTTLKGVTKPWWHEA